MNRKWIIIATLISVVFLSFREAGIGLTQVSAVDTPHSLGSGERLRVQLKRETGTPPMTLSSIIRQGKLLALRNWVLNGKELVCVITQPNTKSNLGTTTQLIFYEKTGENLVKRYSYETSDWALSMYPLKDVNGNLLTIWGGGSAYHFVVFSAVDGQLRIVLQTGSYSMPEIMDIDNDGEPEILITEGKLIIDGKTRTIISYPQSAILYRWNGNLYETAWVGPWKDRLKGGEVGRP